MSRRSVERWVSWLSTLLLVTAVGASFMEAESGTVLSLVALAAIFCIADAIFFVVRFSGERARRG